MHLILADWFGLPTLSDVMAWIVTVLNYTFNDFFQAVLAGIVTAGYQLAGWAFSGFGSGGAFDLSAIAWNSTEIVRMYRVGYYLGDYIVNMYILSHAVNSLLDVMTTACTLRCALWVYGHVPVFGRGK